ncbi:MAG: sugar ABC transporter permease, partial [Candidatus Hydrogenedentales bacterium]
VVVFDVWHQFGFMLVVLLAGLAALPREYDEAARIDGAGRLRAAWHVTLPLLSPVIFFLVVVGLLAAFQSFASFYALTGNGRGPLNTTESLTVHIYTSFYENGRLGYGAAVAVCLAIGLAGLTLAQWRLLGRRVYYEQ